MKFMNGILRKAVETTREYVQRAKSASKQGVRATYKVKVGQKRSRRREKGLAQKRTMEEQKGLVNKNQLTKWFKKFTPTHFRSPSSPIAASGNMVDLEEEEENLEGEQIKIDENVSNGASHSLCSGLSSPLNHPSPSHSASTASNISLPLLQEIFPIPSWFGSCTQSPTLHMPVKHSPSELTLLEILKYCCMCQLPLILLRMTNCHQLYLWNLEDSSHNLTSKLQSKLMLTSKTSLSPHMIQGLDFVLQGCLELMKMILWKYIDGSGSGWIATSLKTAHIAERGPWLVRKLWEWTRAYIAD